MIDIRHLSIQRVDGTRRPYVPDNTQRLQAYRAYQPVQFGNPLLADMLRAIEYARAETLDGAYPNTEEHA